MAYCGFVFSIPSMVRIVLSQFWNRIRNQSVENAGVAFVKGADERNKFFEKINNQYSMTNKCGRTRQRTNNLRDELIWGRTPPVNWPPCITVHVGVSGSLASLLRQLAKLGVSLRQ